MKVQRIWTGEPLESGNFKEVRNLIAPEGRILGANTQGTVLISALTLAGVSLRVKSFPPALAQARAERGE